MMDAQLAPLRERLHAELQRHERLLVAYSGGVDSAYLAWEAFQVLGQQMQAVIADSPSLARSHFAVAIAFAEAHSIPLRVVQTREMERAEYLRNDGERCFHCKDELFTVMKTIRVDADASCPIAYGRNCDDAGDFRPGQNAAAMHGVVAPLADAGLGKAHIRALAHAFGLEVWDRPASACLSSRLEYGMPVTAEALLQVETAEERLMALGFLQVRVRHHGALARVEIDRSEIEAGVSLAMLDRITDAVRSAGFTYAALDTSGYRSGSMNALLPMENLLAAGRRA